MLSDPLKICTEIALKMYVKKYWPQFYVVLFVFLEQMLPFDHLRHVLCNRLCKIVKNTINTPKFMETQQAHRSVKHACLTEINMLLNKKMIVLYFRHHKIRENTIASFLSAANHVSIIKNAAHSECIKFCYMKYKAKSYLFFVFFSQGAAYVEFDVHLSKDLVPIVYHDLTCCISSKKVTFAFGSHYKVTIWTII